MAEGIEARLALAYPGFALDVHLSLPGRGITALFGASGSGKTTCLRALAGLERAPGGFLDVNGDVWQDEARGIFKPVHRRSLGYVFQEASLFSHLDVRGNLDYGRRRAGPVDPEIFNRTVELLGIGPLLERRPDHLSGGERQRVAIARALLTRPRLLLLDEPLAALDLPRKAEVLPYLERLHTELEIPAIYVSHVADEVARLADHLVVLAEGRVVASGPLQETLARLDLASSFADDAGVIIDTVVGAHDEADHLTRLDFAGGAIYVPRRNEAPGTPLRCRIHAREVSLMLERPTATSILNLLPVTVMAVTDGDNPANVLVQLNAAGTAVLARITRRSWNALHLEPGTRVWAQVKAAALLG